VNSDPRKIRRRAVTALPHHRSQQLSLFRGFRAWAARSGTAPSLICGNDWCVPSDAVCCKGCNNRIVPKSLVPSPGSPTRPAHDRVRCKVMPRTTSLQSACPAPPFHWAGELPSGQGGVGAARHQDCCLHRTFLSSARRFTKLDPRRNGDDFIGSRPRDSQALHTSTRVSLF
jgi:hypothetical protein